MREEIVDFFKETKLKNEIIQMVSDIYDEIWKLFKALKKENIIQEGENFYYVIDEHRFNILGPTDNCLFLFLSQEFGFNVKVSEGFKKILQKYKAQKYRLFDYAETTDLVRLFQKVFIPTIWFSLSSKDTLYDYFVEKLRYELLTNFFEMRIDFFKTFAFFGSFNGMGDVEILKREDFSLILEQMIIGFPDWIQVVIKFSGHFLETKREVLKHNLENLANTYKKSFELLHPKSATYFKKDLHYEFENEDLERDFLDKFEEYVQAYFNSEQEKTVRRSIRNAICLLIDADNQENSSLRCALCVAAIEALLGERGEALTEKLATCVATLLEPETEKRLNAEIFFKKIYNFRSRVLHGELEEKAEEFAVQARHLAAAVLDAVICHYEFSVKAGYDPKDKQEFIKELRESKYRTGIFIGSEKNYNVRDYWLNIS